MFNIQNLSHGFESSKAEIFKCILHDLWWVKGLWKYFTNRTFDFLVILRISDPRWGCKGQAKPFHFVLSYIIFYIILLSLFEKRSLTISPFKLSWIHYNDVIMGTMASQITSLTIVYSTVYSGAHQRKHQSSASLAFVRGIHRGRWIPRTNGQ